ncbi:MAG TPA: anti-sigma factor [Fimbriimonas sp.]|nr:anti-sigma factor [Fimbriimonas sp.]
MRSGLSAFIDREVGPAELCQIRAHLVDCEACRKEEQDLRCLKSLLAGVPAPEPTVGLEERILANIHSAPKLRKGPWAYQVGQLALVLSAAAVTMVVTLQLITLHTDAPRVTTPTRHDMTSDIRIDQVREADSLDPLYGAPMITAVDYGR